MPQASRAEAKNVDDRPRNIVLVFSVAALEFETAGLKHIPDGRAGGAHHARTYGRKRRGPHPGSRDSGFSERALRSMRATFPIVGIGIETEARPSLRSRHTRSTY